MGILSGRDFKDALFINMDGIRIGGPGGSSKHRLMEANDPDRLTPFLPYYSSWFHEIKRGIEYKNQKVCFKEIYFQPAPGVSWIWDGWSEVKPCAVKTYKDKNIRHTIPSPLFQSFNLRKYFIYSCTIIQLSISTFHITVHFYFVILV